MFAEELSKMCDVVHTSQDSLDRATSPSLISRTVTPNTHVARQPAIRGKFKRRLRAPCFSIRSPGSGSPSDCLA